MSYSGYLLKVGSYTVPMKYIKVQSYKCSPMQRQEMYAYRNYGGYLYRSTMGHKPTKVEFETTTMTGEEVASMISSLGIEGNLQRRVSVTYYNPITNDYASGTFYVPNIEYTIDEIVNGTVLYKAVRFAFIEY